MDGSRPPSSHDIQSSRARNIYGNTYASGNAQLHLGDTFHYSQLPRLKYVEGAEFDSYEQVHTACHPETRKVLLQNVQAWAKQPDSKSIFWLNGMAGTGKSTIAYTVAKWLNEQQNSSTACLGASFFFKRGEGDRASAAYFFPTIASQLGRTIPGLNTLIEREIDKDAFVCSKALGHQFDKLIRRPLQALDTSQWRRNYVIVIDALDECDTFADIETLLQLWSSLFVSFNPPLRLFVTSRPELPVRISFADMSSHSYLDLILHELPAPVIKQDILTFLRDELTTIRKHYNRCFPRSAPLTRDWPGDETLNRLTTIAVPLFVMATTLCRYIYDKKNPSHFDPLKRLNTVLSSTGPHALSKIGQVYHAVLLQVLPSAEELSEDDYLYQEAQICKQFRSVVGAIIALAEPLPMDALSLLLNKDTRAIELCVSPLHSVLSIPPEANQSMRLLHLSFGEYLCSEDLADKRFRVDPVTIHRSLLSHCLQLLSRSGVLHEDMCNLRHPGQLRQEVAADVIQQHISPSVQYACRYWTHHCQRSQTDISDDDGVHGFLQKHFLHWLEVMSLLNTLGEVIEHIRSLQPLVSQSNAIHVNALLADAERFLLANRYVIDLAPLQVYSSAVIFLPQSSIVREIYDSQIPPWITQCPMTPATWSEELQTLEGHTDWVNAVVFSPSGLLLASASHVGDIRLWSTRTGQEMQKLEGHTEWVKAVTFSPDGSQLASASADKTIRVWNVSTGQAVRVLKGHTHAVVTVAFSPDGLQLASASYDKTVRIWDFKASKQIHILTGHEYAVNLVVFSPDGSLLASASEDDTIRLWSTRSWDKGTDREVRIIEGCDDSVEAVAFSPDGTQLASISGSTIRLWYTSTSSKLKKFDLSHSSLKAVTFYPDGSLLASASGQAIQLWDVATGKVGRTLDRHSGTVTSIAFSPDGLLLASASEDKTIRLWKIQLYDTSRDRRTSSITPTPGPAPFTWSTIRALDSSLDGPSDIFKYCLHHGHLDLEDSWIKSRGIKLLWLPPEHHCKGVYSCTSSKGQFTIKVEDGLISFR